MDITVTENVQDVLTFLEKYKNRKIVCDIETTSLTVSKGEILCVAFSPTHQVDILVWWPQDLTEIAQISLPKAIFHHSQFDKRWLISYGAKVKTVWDTLLMGHLIDENNSLKLKDLGERLLGIKDWSNEDVANLAKLPQDEVSVYVAKDIYGTRELFRWQLNYIKKNRSTAGRFISVMQNLTLPAVDALIEMEDNGIPIRIDKLTEIKAEIECELATLDQELDKSIPPREEWPEYLQKTTPNWGITNWTRWWLYEYQEADCFERGKPSARWPYGTPSLSQAVLSKIDHPAAELLARRNTLNKLFTGFLIPLEARTVKGRVFTSYKLHGTVTGRLSSASPSADNPGINSQQIPRDKRIRNLFGQCGLAWIEADYSQLELRVAAVLAEDKTMLQLFKSGADIHTYMAERLTGGKATKQSRTLAKGVNFGFLYGMRVKHFCSYINESYGLFISDSDAQIFREEYFKTFSGLEPWYKKQRREAIKYGGVFNEFGRFRHLPKVYAEDYWIQENAFRQAVNAPVQSLGSDFMILSISRLGQDPRLRELGAKLVATVHDSVCLTAPYGAARQVARIVKRTMEKADDELTRKFLLKADVTISRVWGGEALASY